MIQCKNRKLGVHPNASDCLNAHSHIGHLFMGTSEFLPVVDGKLMLGTWQRIFAIELDCARNREVFAGDGSIIIMTQVEQQAFLPL